MKHKKVITEIKAPKQTSVFLLDEMEEFELLELKVAEPELVVSGSDNF
jgi:hypothetical protein